MYKYVNGKKMKNNEKNFLDQYFTKPEEALRLFNFAKKTILKYEKNLDKFTWVEPATGDGVFLDLLDEKKRIGIDIDPKRSDVIKQDYLKYQIKNEPTIIIGNPPFGNRGVIALEFINHSINADYVCFILPMFFESVGKGSIKYRVKGFNLLDSIPVNKNSFYIPNEDSEKRKEIDVKCCFQVWGKQKSQHEEFSWYSNNNAFKNLIDVVTVSTAKKRECGKKWIFEEQANYYIASTFFKNNNVVRQFKDVKYGSGLAIIYKTKDDTIVKQLNNIFENADWIKYSSLATNSCRHIGKSHIFQLLKDNELN